jgi:hypothetical protein
MYFLSFGEEKMNEVCVSGFRIHDSEEVLQDSEFGPEECKYKYGYGKEGARD